MRRAALAVLMLVSAVVSAAPSPGAVEAAARAGDYQAQRNLAYGLFTGTGGFSQDGVRACLWSSVIVLSGNPRADMSDASNLDFRCGRLSPTDRTLATRQAEELVPTIDWRTFERRRAAHR